MLGGRGVALGMGKLHLNDLKAMPGQAIRITPRDQTKPKVVIRKHIDRQTFWAACRATICGCVLMAVGALMTTAGFLDFSPSLNASQLALSKVGQLELETGGWWVHLKALGYVGPIIMGCGTFILMIACVMTLENRDKHAEVIETRPKRISGKSVKKQSRVEKQPIMVEALNTNTVQDTSNALRTTNDDPLNYAPASSEPGGSAPLLQHTPLTPIRQSQLLIDMEIDEPDQTDHSEPQQPISTQQDHMTARALLHRFLDDQSRAAADMQLQMHRRHTSHCLSLSQRDLPPPRMTRSDEMRPTSGNEPHVAQVHPAPVVLCVASATNSSDRSLADLVADRIDKSGILVSKEDRGEDAQRLNLGASNSLTLETTPHTSTGRNSDASFVTARTSRSVTELNSISDGGTKKLIGSCNELT